ncbi:MAG: hypothetical protein MUO43_18830 [Desulfobacterales bacterium]|nr:hypothetical protein [Desulfobacterales bacterium]
MKDKLEITDEMIGATDGKTCCRVFADPFIRKTKKVKIHPVDKKPHANHKSAKKEDKRNLSH